MNIYAPNGVRTEARIKVAKLIQPFKGERRYLGLPHTDWVDFKLVKEMCPNIVSGLGFEYKPAVFGDAYYNKPEWCTIKNMYVGTYAQFWSGLSKTSLVSAGWFDAMSKVDSPSFVKACQYMPRLLDHKFKSIPMAFSWFSGRETDSKLLDNVSLEANGVGWDFTTPEQKEQARAYCVIDMLNKASKDWVYEPTEISQLRVGSSMKLMLGVYHRAA